MSSEPPSEPNYRTDHTSLMVRIDKITTEETIPLRHSVLWPNMPLSHVSLEEDALGIHYGAFLSLREPPVAVISLFLEDLPRRDRQFDPEYLNSAVLAVDNDEDTGRNIPIMHQHQQHHHHQRQQQEQAVRRTTVRFRKFACEREYQGKGIGTQLLMHVLSIAQSELNAATVWCDARATASAWYVKRGLTPFGPTFYKGPEEYIRMRTDFCETLKRKI